MDLLTLGYIVASLAILVEILSKQEKTISFGQ